MREAGESNRFCLAMAATRHRSLLPHFSKNGVIVLPSFGERFSATVSCLHWTLCWWAPSSILHLIEKPQCSTPAGFPVLLQWDRMDNKIWWARVGQWIPWTVPPILHGTVGIPMDYTTCPMVQWNSLLCSMDSDGKLGHPLLLKCDGYNYVLIQGW